MMKIWTVDWGHSSWGAISETFQSHGAKWHKGGGDEHLGGWGVGIWGPEMEEGFVCLRGGFAGWAHGGFEFHTNHKCSRYLVLEIWCYPSNQPTQFLS
jgi:hypothetical protein